MKIKLSPSTTVNDKDGKPIKPDKDGCIDVDDVLGKALLAGQSAEEVKDDKAARPHK